MDVIISDRNGVSPPDSPPSATGSNGSTGLHDATLWLMLLIQSINQFMGSSAELAKKYSLIQQSLAEEETTEMSKLNPDDIKGNDQEKSLAMNKLMVKQQQLQAKFQSYLTPIQTLTDGMQQLSSDASTSLSHNYQNFQGLIDVEANLSRILAG